MDKIWYFYVMYCYLDKRKGLELYVLIRIGLEFLILNLKKKISYRMKCIE